MTTPMVATGPSGQSIGTIETCPVGYGASDTRPFKGVSMSRSPMVFRDRRVKLQRLLTIPGVTLGSDLIQGTTRG